MREHLVYLRDLVAAVATAQEQESQAIGEP